MIINLSKENIKESINKNKFFIITFILLCFSIYFFVVPTFIEYIKIKIMEYNISKIIDEQGEEILNIEKELLKKEEEEAIKKIKNEYIAKNNSINEKYKKIIEDYKKDLIKNKTIAIKSGEDDEHIGYIEAANIKTEVLKKMKQIFSFSENIINSKIYEIKEKTTLSTNNKNSKEKIENYEGKEYIFSLIEEKKEGNIIVYDKSKLGVPIDLGINFPTLFSYKNNKINIQGVYYDLHKGTDFKTMPYKNILIKFPQNKKGKVVYARQDGYGNRLIIDNKEDNERYEYAHLQDILVKEGDEITGNQKIAITGNTGPYSLGYHLHYSVYKDGMLSTYDWGIDMDHEELLKKIYPHKDLDFIIPYIKKVPANIPQALGIYVQLPDNKRNKKSFDKIMSIILENENKGDFSFQTITKNNFIKENIKKDSKEIFKWMIAFVDSIDEIRKKELIKYIRNNSDYNITLFDQEKIAPKKMASNNKNKTIDFSFIDEKIGLKKFNLAFLNSAFVQKKRELLKINECSNEINETFEQYTPSQSISDNHLLNDENIKNINKLFPIIYKSAQELNIAERINKKFNLEGSEKITNCDITFIEIGKWYQEHNLGLDNPNKYGIFQNISINYYKLFPSEKGALVLSDAQYMKQSKDSMEHSFGKLSYIKGKTFRKRKVDKDFLLKYWVWSYHGLIGDEPEKDYYVSNNLIYNGLKIVDISAKPGSLGTRDGAFTFALKLYKLSKT